MFTFNLIASEILYDKIIIGDEYMDEELKGHISYEQLRQIVFDYFKKFQGLSLGSISIGYLRTNLTGKGISNDFFILDGEFGETRFNLTKDQLQKILAYHLASKGCRLIKESYDDQVYFTYQKDPEISVDDIERVELDIPLDGSIDYTVLRQIVFDHYKERYGVTLNSISIDYLRTKLKGGGNTQPFFIRNDEFGETRFDIPAEELKEILREYLAKKGYDLISLFYDNNVVFKYKPIKGFKKEEEIHVEFSPTPFGDGSDEMRDESSPVPPTPGEVGNGRNESTSSIDDSENRKKDTVPPIWGEPEDYQEEVTETPEEELARMAREGRRFTILQRERAVSDAQRARVRAAIMAGICMLGAAAAIIFNGQDPNVVIQHELQSIYSWDALVQYFQDLGPAVTLLSTGAVGFVARYLRHSRRFRDAQHQIEDFNASLERDNAEELGGNENARTR